MLPLEWVDQLSIDRGTIDDQHKHLFDLYNRCARAEPQGMSKDELLAELADYASRHFAAEEAVMLAVGYDSDRYEHHLAAHRGFSRRLNDLSVGPFYLCLDFVREWLLTHIMIDDKKIADHIRKSQGT